MRNYQTKINTGGVPDSIQTNKLGAGEVNSYLQELENAVSRSNQTLAPDDGTAEVFIQLGRALFINGTAAMSFVDSGAANAYVVTPQTGDTGLVVPSAYVQMDGMVISFIADNTNTGASTLNIGQTTGTLLGAKSIRYFDGSALTGGEITANERITLMFDEGNDYWVFWTENFAKDDKVVHLAGDETITGNKTFSTGQIYFGVNDKIVFTDGDDLFTFNADGGSGNANLKASTLQLTGNLLTFGAGNESVTVDESLNKFTFNADGGFANLKALTLQLTGNSLTFGAGNESVTVDESLNKFTFNADGGFANLKAATLQLTGNSLTFGAGNNETITVDESLRRFTFSGNGDPNDSTIRIGRMILQDSAAITSIVTGTSNNDKLPTQGYVDDKFIQQLLHVQDQKAQNTYGGTFTSGAWQTRDLNTVLTNEISGASLSSNQITLPAGTYRITAKAPASDVQYHQARLYNITDVAVTVLGTCEESLYDDNDSGNTTSSWCTGQFTIASSKVFELQHRCATSKSTQGFGTACNFTNEVYSDVQIFKVA